MNKLTLTLAAGAFALISACSDDKKEEKSLAELCNPLTAECLEGTWRLNGVTDAISDCPETGTLVISDVSENTGNYNMKGGVYQIGIGGNDISGGTLTLNNNVITINENYTWDTGLTGTVKVSEDGNTMTVTSNSTTSVNGEMKSMTVFSRCTTTSGKIEEFIRQ